MKAVLLAIQLSSRLPYIPFVNTIPGEGVVGVLKVDCVSDLAVWHLRFCDLYKDLW